MGSEKPIGISNLGQSVKSGNGSIGGGGAQFSDRQQWMILRSIQQELWTIGGASDFPHYQQQFAIVDAHDADSLDDVIMSQASLIKTYVDQGRKSMTAYLHGAKGEVKALEFDDMKMSGNVLSFKYRWIMSLSEVMRIIREFKFDPSKFSMMGDDAQLSVWCDRDLYSANIGWPVLLGAYATGVGKAAEPGMVAFFDGDDWYLFDKDGNEVKELRMEQMTVDLTPYLT